MDEAHLKKIMENIETPEPDINAQKRAVNLAMSEFKDHRQKKSKKFQGFSRLARLMGNSNSKDRRTTMEKRSHKKLLQGTAMLVAGVSLFALPVAFEAMFETVGTGSSVDSAQLKKVEFSTVGGGNNFSAISSNITSSITRSRPREKAKTRQDAPAYVQAIEERNEAEADMAQGSSALSAPAAAPVGIVAMKEVKKAGRMVAQESVAIGNNMVVADQITPNFYKDEGRDKFEDFKINPIKIVGEEPVSTFSVDVDTASYSFMRRQLNNGVLPQKDAVRVEELINYFDYNYPLPESREQPFKPTVSITKSPWAEGKKLMHIGIKGFDVQDEKPRSNLVFLLDTSGSMNSPDKLPLVKNSLKMMLDNMNENDTISIVVYAGSAGTVLEPTKASEKGKIIAALDRLSAGGSTAGAAGINLAYQLAEESFDDEAVNRVILATDGDFNVGITNHEELQDFVERKRETGIFLSVLGFGQGNYNDHMMQVLAQNGNGVAAYIDNLNEARKVLVEEATSSLFTIAKDVKIQVEFNPKTVSEYRLVGYETRALNREDFNNDKVDAGDIGAGHTVTAIYEITPVGSESVSVDPLRYSEAEEKAVMSDMNGEYAFLKMRYKLPNESKSKLITTPVTVDNEVELTKIDCGPDEDCVQSAGNDTRFATAVAGFGQLLKGGQYTGDFTYDDVITLAKSAKGEDDFGYRAEFINLVRLAKSARN